MRSLGDRIAVLLGTSLYAGFAPVAPGTFGSAVGVAIVFLARHWRWQPYLLLTAAVSVAGVWAAHRCRDVFRDKDPHQVVIDEVAGMLLSLAAVPRTLGWTAAGFLLFRAFDIVKPPPARWADRKLDSGVGIMLDDLVAGVYTWLVLQGALLLAR